VLTYSTSTSDTNNPQAAAVDPFGAFALAVETATDDVLITIPYVGLVGTVPTGLSPVAITIDPTSQFVYVANSGDGNSLGLQSFVGQPVPDSDWRSGSCWNDSFSSARGALRPLLVCGQQWR